MANERMIQTGLRLPESLYVKAKVAAAKARMSLGEWVAAAIREKLGLTK